MNSLLLTVLLQLQNPAQKAVQAQFPKGTRVLLVGDSLAQGMTSHFIKLAKENGYIPLVKSKSGTRCDQWSSKIGEIMSRSRPKVVFVSLGTNDAAMSNPEVERKHVKRIKNRVQIYGGKLVWLLPHNLPPQLKKRDVVNKILSEELTPQESFDSNNINLALGRDKIHMKKDGYKDWITAAWNSVFTKE